MVNLDKPTIFYYLFIIMENSTNSLSDPTNILTIDSMPEISNNGDTSWGFWSILGVSLIIIIILAIAGLNIFSYLAVGTQDTANWIERIASTLKQYTNGFQISSGLGNVVGVSALGTREIIDTASKDINYVSSSVDKIAENVLDPIIQKTSTLKGISFNDSPSVSVSQGPIPSPITSQGIQPSNNTENNSLNRAINRQQALEGGLSKGPNYNADDSASTIQKTSGKSGWCYIGNDNGTRTCARVGENQMCMSGDIFPTSEVCVNPNLRP